MPLVSRVEMARLLTVTPDRVRQLIQSGVIPTRDVDKKLDPVLVAQGIVQHMSDAPESKVYLAARHILDTAGEVEAQSNNTLNFAAARARKEHYRALQEELTYKKLVGELVDAADVQHAASRTARLVRDSLLAIPDRCAAMIAAESNVNKCHELILLEVENALSELSVEQS